jgi:hypothetical protein
MSLCCKVTTSRDKRKNEHFFLRHTLFFTILIIFSSIISTFSRIQLFFSWVKLGLTHTLGLTWAGVTVAREWKWVSSPISHTVIVTEEPKGIEITSHRRPRRGIASPPPRHEAANTVHPPSLPRLLEFQ